MLPHRVWRAEGGPPRALLLALHGFNEHGGNFLLDSLGQLTAAGVEVHTYDQRGFGQAPSRGYWPGTETMARDAAAAAAYLKARNPDVPLFLLGESMGAAVALLAETGRYRRRSTGWCCWPPPSGRATRWGRWVWGLLGPGAQRAGAGLPRRRRRHLGQRQSGRAAP
ncbi:alpha/beta fold hydrolase [Pseudoroseomonas wenyumeiae]